MITREEYMLKKLEIEEKMKKSRTDQHNEIAAVNEEFGLRLRDLSDAYRRQRNALFEERDAKRLEIEGKFKDQRRDLWIEDCVLVSQWRSQLKEVELTPPTNGGEQPEEEGGRNGE